MPRPGTHKVYRRRIMAFKLFARESTSYISKHNVQNAKLYHSVIFSGFLRNRSMATRTRCSILKRNYCELANVNVPKISPVSCLPSAVKRSGRNDDSSSEKLYRLRIVETDSERGQAKVQYIGYGAEWDEWRLLDDIVEFNDSFSSDEAATIVPGRFCLYEEMRNNIKALLDTKRKGDPVWTIVMCFDMVYFEGLIRLGIRTNGRRNNDVYQLRSLSKLDDILEERWNIHGLNTNGDLCYVLPKTVKYYIKNTKQKVDYQMRVDGSLTKHTFGRNSQLVFHFICGDGTSAE